MGPSTPANPCCSFSYRSAFEVTKRKLAMYKINLIGIENRTLKKQVRLVALLFLVICYLHSISSGSSFFFPFFFYFFNLRSQLSSNWADNKSTSSKKSDRVYLIKYLLLWPYIPLFKTKLSCWDCKGVLKDIKST